MGKNLWRLHTLFVALFLDADSLAVSESFEASSEVSIVSEDSGQSTNNRSAPPLPAQRPLEDFNDIPRP